MKKTISCALIAALFLLCVFPAMPVEAAFQRQKKDITGDMVKYLGLNGKYRPHTQGMCVAGQYLIVTRWTSNSSPTTFMVIDLKTKKEVGHYDFQTGHSNSLTYNSDKQELVVVSDGTAYLFSFKNGKIEKKNNVYMGCHAIKVAYVSSEKSYYVSTGTRMYKTTDFKSLSLKFKSSELATNQGMASDGKNLFICWWGNKNNTIQVLSTTGKSIVNYVLDDQVCDEIEELDFYGGNMYINITNSGQNNGVYVVKGEGGKEVANLDESLKTDEKPKKEKVEKPKEEAKPAAEEKKQEPETPKTEEPKQENAQETPQAEKEVHTHTYSDWVVTKKPTCVDEGVRERKCTTCDEKQTEKIPATGKHTAGDWEVVTPATCTENGLQQKKCTVCGKVLEQEEIPATDHIYSYWKKSKTATVFEAEEYTRTCVVCGHKEVDVREPLEPFLVLDKVNVETAWYKDPFTIKADVNDGDLVVSYKSSNPDVASVNKKGEVTPHFPGEATITVKTKSGLTEKCKVKVGLVK